MCADNGTVPLVLFPILLLLAAIPNTQQISLQIGKNIFYIKKETSGNEFHQTLLH